MAEVAPLTSAHAHVRKATEEFRQIHWSQAADEHQQASADFARAARGTNDTEALRVLKLLEEQHQKLARIIKEQDAAQQENVDEQTKAADQSQASNDAPAQPIPADTASASRKTASTSTTAAKARVAAPPRDSSPSLARDIASRRGIPQPGGTRPSPAAQARARQLSPNSRRRLNSGSSSKVPPSVVDSQANLQPPSEVRKTADDEGFTKFYNSLTTGTLSKLSSALAYAGLPLTYDENSNDQPSKQKRSKRTVSAGNEPDVKKIFSKAALDALEDEHRQRGTLGNGFGPTESFYIVQKGGGTYSYADIARTHHQQHLSGVGEEEEEPEFVDAKEVQGQISPKQSRFSQSAKRGSFGSPRTTEELDLENATLKQTLQDLAGRLAVFEAHAQDASFAALTQSVSNLRSQGGTDPATEDRIRQLEKEVDAQTEERQKLETLASKQERMLKKYQSKFEEIKKSAREKDKAKKDKAAKEAEESAAEAVQSS